MNELPLFASSLSPLRFNHAVSITLSQDSLFRAAGRKARRRGSRSSATTLSRRGQNQTRRAVQLRTMNAIFSAGNSAEPQMRAAHRERRSFGLSAEWKNLAVWR